MTVHDCCPTSVISSPVKAHRQTVGIRFARSFTIKTKFTHSCRTTPNILLFQSCMSNDQLSVIKNIVADKSVYKLCNLSLEIFALRFNLCYRLINTVCHGNALATQIFEQLYIMVSGNGNRISAFYHIHNEPHNIGISVSSIAEIAEKGSRSAVRVSIYAVRSHITQLIKQHFQLITAAVNISDDVKRSVQVFLVIPQLCADNLCVVELFKRVYHIHKAETLTLQALDTALHISAVLTDHTLGEITLRTGFVALLHDLLGQVKHDRRRMDILLSCKVDDLFSCTLLDISRINDRHLHIVQAFVSRIIQ